MKKVALLIGVSEYEPELTPLPAAAKDIVSMQRVLENPDIGGFDEVKMLLNPEQDTMSEAIENLFLGLQKDDLVLLFFSGHGVKDDNGKLYFVTRNTRRNDRVGFLKATAVAASFVHDIMDSSRSKHQVVILDCCFSGAFAHGMLARSDNFVDVRKELGGEGRAILTSSTSTQYSFEEKEADNSVYTRYIVEGMETGAADQHEDGKIYANELHEYAKGKVQEVSPAMKPEIYSTREGFNICLAKAPTNDPNLKYRREVEHWVNAGDGDISDVGRDTLDELKLQLQLPKEATAIIEGDVLKPHQEYQRKLSRYQEVFRRKINQEYPISDRSREELKRLQKILNLTDEKIALIEVPIIEENIQQQIKQNEDIASIKDFIIKDISEQINNAFFKINEDVASIKDFIIQDTSEQINNAVSKTNEDVASIKDSIKDISEQINNEVSKTNTAERKLLFIGLFTIIASSGASIFINYLHTTQPPVIVACQNNISNNEVNTNTSGNLEISSGEQILQPGNTNSCKKDGTKAFADKQYDLASKKFEASIKNNPNDPESLIYLNNAKARKNGQSLKLAVSIPTTKNSKNQNLPEKVLYNIAGDILRGVAQAQNEVNSNGGINGKLLEVVIANDNNDKATGSKIAQAFVNMSEIFGVVGHYSSQLTIEANNNAYNSGGLVAVSPSSTSVQLNNINRPYIFRMPTGDKISANKLARYIVETRKKKKVAIFYNSKDDYSASLKSLLSVAVQQGNGAQVSNEFDISQYGFNASQAVTKAIQNGSTVMMIVIDTNNIDKGWEVINAAQNKNLLFVGGDSFLDENTLERRKEVAGMILRVPWDVSKCESQSQPNFCKKSQDLWSVKATWRTAMSYDATKVFIAALNKNPTRDGVKTVLSNNFSFTGATGKISFNSGDRSEDTTALVEVQQKSGTYEFVPITIKP